MSWCVFIILRIVFESVSVSGAPCKLRVYARNCAGLWETGVDEQRVGSSGEERLRRDAEQSAPESEILPSLDGKRRCLSRYVNF